MREEKDKKDIRDERDRRKREDNIKTPLLSKEGGTACGGVVLHGPNRCHVIHPTA